MTNLLAVTLAYRHMYLVGQLEDVDAKSPGKARRRRWRWRRSGAAAAAAEEEERW